jgi:hypothetical protein
MGDAVMSEAMHPAPLRLFTLVRRDEPTVPAAEPSGIIPTFATEELARAWIADAVDRLSWIVVPLVAIPPAPPRIEAWGPGQHDRAQLGPCIEAWVRITPEGRVRLVIPGGDLDVTDGAVTLSLGLQEASARAAQIRVRHEERRARKRQRRSGDSR